MLLEVTFHGAIHLSFGVAFGDVLALVVLLLPFTDANFDFDPGTFEVEGEGDEGVALLLNDTGEAVNLVFVDQQLTRSVGVVIEPIALQVLFDVAVDKPKLTIFHCDVRVFEAHL